MGKFGRALAGGIAGAAGAAGEVFSSQIKNKEYDRRAAILDKREKTLASFRNELALGRDESRYAQQEKVTADERAYQEGSAQSGMISPLGMPLSKRDLSRQSDVDVGKNVSVQDYKTGEEARTWEQDKREIDYKSEKAEGLARIRGENRSLAAPKDPTVKPAEFKRAQDNALAGVESKLSQYTPYYNPETKAYELDVAGKSKEEINAILTYIDSKGFQFSGTQPDENTLMLSLGEFDYDKYKKSLSPEAKTTYEKVDQAEKDAQSSLKQILNALGKTAGRSKMNSQPGAFDMKKSHGLATPRQ